MTSWQDENGNTVVENTYDEQGRVVSQTDANGNTASLTYGEDHTVMTDNRGNETTVYFDELGVPSVPYIRTEQKQAIPMMRPGTGLPIRTRKATPPSMPMMKMEIWCPRPAGMEAVHPIPIMTATRS